MILTDKVVVVTGGANGIGKALCERFHAEGARLVVVADLELENAKTVANSIGGEAFEVNVRDEAQIVAMVEDVQSRHGAIDLFCSNAGVGMGLNEQSPDQEWQMSWDINVMSHVYAARHLVPRMIERGEGYFLNTASAAGLLNQVGGAAYGVSKHAAVGFGEWLALTYAHQGIKVSMLCPQAVRTAMTVEDDEADGASATKAAAGDGMMEPEELADIVIEGLERESFLILTHPEVETYMQRKTADYDRWIKGMNRLHLSLTGE